MAVTHNEALQAAKEEVLALHAEDRAE